jgi:hypothetical protein
VRTIAVDCSGRRQGDARHIWAADVAAGDLGDAAEAFGDSWFEDCDPPF